MAKRPISNSLHRRRIIEAFEAEIRPAYEAGMFLESFAKDIIEDLREEFGVAQRDEETIVAVLKRMHQAWKIGCNDTRESIKDSI